MVAVPAAIPVTAPVLPTVAIPVAPLPQVPPVTPSDRVTTVDWHKANVPVIVPAGGKPFTVTTAVATAVPQLFITV